MRQLLRSHALNIALVLISVVIVLLVYVSVRADTVTTSNCRQIQQLDHAIYGVLKRGEQVLGTKGSAGFAYYRDHPSELQAARQQIAQELTSFTPHACT